MYFDIRKTNALCISEQRLIPSCASSAFILVAAFKYLNRIFQAFHILDVLF